MIGRPGKRMATRRDQDQRGFTIVEILVITVVIAILGGLLIDFMVDKIVASARLSAESNLQQEAKLTLDSANNDLKHSTGADDANRWADNNAPVASDPFSWAGDGDTLILARPATDAGNNILFENEPSYTTYKDNRIFFLDNGTLYRRTLAADAAGNSATTTCPVSVADATCPADTELVNNVTDFTITYFDNTGNVTAIPSDAGSVEITIAISDTVFGRVISGSHTLTGVFRGIN